MHDLMHIFYVRVVCIEIAYARAQLLCMGRDASHGVAGLCGRACPLLYPENAIYLILFLCSRKWTDANASRFTKNHRDFEKWVLGRGGPRAARSPSISLVSAFAVAYYVILRATIFIHFQRLIRKCGSAPIDSALLPARAIIPLNGSMHTRT